MMERICSKLLVYEDEKVKRLEFGLKEFLEDRQSTRNESQREKEEQKMLIESEISYVLGELCKNAQGTDEYVKMDLRFKELIGRKKEMGL
jgi:macrolide transport system ATP-binding/permease protein